MMAGPRRGNCYKTQPHPRATARVPTPLHTAPALTKIRGNSSARRSLCKGGGRVDEGWGPLRSPSGEGGGLLALGGAYGRPRGGVVVSLSREERRF